MIAVFVPLVKGLVFAVLVGFVVSCICPLFFCCLFCFRSADQQKLGGSKMCFCGVFRH